jgi:integrase
MAAEINAQLEVGAPSAFGFEPISFVDLRQRWLDHHEHVRRSSLATIARYRTATQHLLAFIEAERPLKRASDFRPSHAMEFVRYLRNKKVAPNGCKRAKQRPLRDTGIKFILETCCSLFNYALRQRHLPPYVENPFRTIEVSRIPIEDAKPIVPFSAEQEVELLKACDDWQFPIILTLLCTGLRPGELVHLLLPDDLDLTSGWLYVRNKPQLGWQVKTRNERDIPLIPALLDVLRSLIGDRTTGPVFVQRRYLSQYHPPLANRSRRALEAEAARRLMKVESASSDSLIRIIRQESARTVWRDLGALKQDWIRTAFKRLTKSIDLPELTAPKLMRHTFATILQDSNVDPLVRNELMGHAPSGLGLSNRGLGMTAIYTHTRPETKRRYLEQAFAERPAVDYARQRLRCMPTHDPLALPG